MGDQLSAISNDYVFPSKPALEYKPAVTLFNRGRINWESFENGGVSSRKSKWVDVSR